MLKDKIWARIEQPMDITVPCQSPGHIPVATFTGLKKRKRDVSKVKLRPRPASLPSAKGSRGMLQRAIGSAPAEKESWQ